MPQNKLFLSITVSNKLYQITIFVVQVKNIFNFNRNILQPLGETFDQFWVRNEDPNMDLTGSGAYFFGPDWVPLCNYYDKGGIDDDRNYTVSAEDCATKKSFVCEKDVY